MPVWLGTLGGWLGKGAFRLALLAAACFFLWKAASEVRGIKADEDKAKQDYASAVSDAEARGFANGRRFGSTAVYAWYLQGQTANAEKRLEADRKMLAQQLTAFNDLTEAQTSTAKLIEKGMKNVVSFNQTPEARKLCLTPDVVRAINQVILSANAASAERSGSSNTSEGNSSPPAGNNSTP